MLKFDDSNFIWFDLKNSWYDICGKVKLMSFFGFCAYGMDLFYIILSHACMHTHNIHIYEMIYNF